VLPLYLHLLVWGVEHDDVFFSVMFTALST
jgi:hypothetical protein